MLLILNGSAIKAGCFLSSFHLPSKHPADRRSGYEGTSCHCLFILLSYRSFTPFRKRVQTYG
ncbi:hypothetical protein E1J02_26850 [Phocaeicola dorei]|nr:hypothetical protein E1J02_26850 [Phocaeicola dorei]